MEREEIDAFLGRTSPALVGVVGTLRPDGSPHTVPVWYRWDGEVVHIWTLEGRAWVRNLLRDPRVAFSVQETEPPFAAVVMRGRAEVARGDAPEVTEEIRRIVRRYLDEEETEDYLSEWSEARTLVRIHPTTIRAWSRGY